MRVVGHTQIQRVVSSPGKPRIVTEIRIHEYDIESLPKNCEILYIGCTDSPFPEKKEFIVLLKKKVLKNLKKTLVFIGKHDKLEKVEIEPDDVALDIEKEKIMFIILPSHKKEKDNYIRLGSNPHIAKDGINILMETLFTKWDDEKDILQNSHCILIQ